MKKKPTEKVIIEFVTSGAGNSVAIAKKGSGGTRVAGVKPLGGGVVDAWFEVDVEKLLAAIEENKYLPETKINR